MSTDTPNQDAIADEWAQALEEQAASRPRNTAALMWRAVNEDRTLT